MAYRLEQTESVGQNVRRVATEQIEGAIAELLQAAAGDPDEPIHGVRKRLKKLRGLVRLVRGDLGELAYARENACFRDAARELSGARTATAVIGAFDALVPEGAFAEARRALESMRTRAVASAVDPTRIADVESTLALARRRVQGWPLERDRWKAIEPGLRRSYAAGRDAFAAARRDPSVEHLHEWRKRVKDHWYHARLLTRIWHQPMRARRKALGKLSELLGDDHDLADLAAALIAEPGLSEDRAELDALLALIERRQHELRTGAFELGRRLYAERPRQLSYRLGEYYAAWRRAAPSRQDGRSGAEPRGPDATDVSPASDR